MVVSSFSRTSPVNIAVNKDARCNLQCNYSFSYPPTTLKIKRQLNYLEFNTDVTAQPPVIYNNRNYSILEVRLYRPSLHKFAGTPADAEMIIMHTCPESLSPLYVCVPITKSSTSTTDATMFLDLIGSEISRTGTGTEGETVFNSPTFTLNKFVPMKPYLSYSGTEPWASASSASTIDFIVFQKENAVYISAVMFHILTKEPTAPATSLWPSHGIQIVKKSVTPAIFFNDVGPVARGGDSIYISCQPTGADGEILTKILPNSSQAIDRLSVKSSTNKMLIKIVIGACLMLLIWKIAIKIIKGLSGSKK